MGVRMPVRMHVRTSHMRGGWLVAGVVVAGFVVTRYVLGAPWAVPLSQLIYLLPVGAAVVLLTLGAFRSPAGSRGRRSWLMLALCAGFVLLGESAYSLAMLLSSQGPASAMGLFDAANAAALCALIAAMAVHSGIVRFGFHRAARIVLDTVALVALAFGVLYRFWSTRVPAGPSEDWDAARFAAYGVLALALLVGAIASFGRRGSRDLVHNRYLAAAIALLAMGVALWAGAGMALSSAGGVAVDVSTVLILVSYALMALAGLARITDRAAPLTSPLPPPLIWPGVVASGLVFVSVVWLGLLTLEAQRGSQAEALYLFAVSIAALCVVGRTALASAEADELDQRSLTDPVTGARGPRALEPELKALLEDAHARDGVACVVVLDLDGFAKINVTSGYRAGDRVLTATARALERAGGRRSVFRLRGDEFVVLAHVSEPAEAERYARSLLNVVRSANADPVLAASVGVAVHPADGDDPVVLLGNAQLASVWAKRHGKARAVRYEPRIGAALRLHGPPIEPDERAKMDMARALVAATDARDPANHVHARNVAALARLLGEELELEAEHVDRIEMAAILHDVGKIALPDVMLGGRTLTFQERSVAREHSVLGERLVDSLAIEGVGCWVRAHHENWDGSGYPDGLSGDAIPLEARIIALADAYDGMKLGKRYGAPMSSAAALQEIDLSIGVRFDPGLAERFIRVVGTTGALGWSDEWARA